MERLSIWCIYGSNTSIVLGLCADLTGFILAAAALHLLPLFLVQSVIAFSVGVTAMISALLGIRLAGPGWIALAIGAGGLVLPMLAFTTTMTVPSLIGLLYLGDEVRPGFVAAAVVGFTLAVAGAIGAAWYASGGQRPRSSVAAAEFRGQTRTGAKVPHSATSPRD